MDSVSEKSVEVSSDVTPLLPPHPPRRLVVVEPIVMLGSLLFMPLSSLLQQWTYRRFTELLSANHSAPVSGGGCGEMNRSSPEYVFRQLVQAETSAFNIYLSVALFVPGLFSSVILASVSDKRGRKVALCAAMLGGTVQVALNAAVIGLDLHPYVLLAGTLVGGCTGGFGVIMSSCFSYIADTTTAEVRASRILLLELCMFIAVPFANIGLGYLIEELGFFYSVLIIACGFILNLGYTLCFVQETVVPTQDKLVTTDTVTNIGRVILKRKQARRWKLLTLLLIFFIHTLTVLGPNQVLTLFQMNPPLCWDSVFIGYYNAVNTGLGTLAAFVGGQLLQRAGVPEDARALLAGLLRVAGFFYILGVQNTAMMFGVPIITMLNFLFTSFIRASLSTLVDNFEQGAAFGALNFLEGLAHVLGPAVFNVTYSHTVETLPRFVFILIGAVYAVAQVFLIFYMVKVRYEERYKRLQRPSIIDELPPQWLLQRRMSRAQRFSLAAAVQHDKSRRFSVDIAPGI